MTLNRRPTPRHRSQSPAASPPAAIWFPEPPGPDSHPEHGLVPEPESQVLPTWAVDRIRAEFTFPRRVGQQRLPLLRLDVPDCRSGMDARTRCTSDLPLAIPRRGVILAELHPDALPSAGTAHPDVVQAEDWPDFFHRTHQLLTQGGLLLVAARQQRTGERLSDPLGALVSCARMAGFIYLQHIVVVHGHLADDHIEPTPPPQAPPGLIHSDLLVFATDAWNAR
jgi:hypothetical protein